MIAWVRNCESPSSVDFVYTLTKLTYVQSTILSIRYL